MGSLHAWHLTEVGVLTNGLPGCPLVKTCTARMLAVNFTPSFITRLMAKDLRRAWELNPMEVAQAALGTRDRAIDSGTEEINFSAVVERLRNRTEGVS